MPNTNNYDEPLFSKFGEMLAANGIITHTGKEWIKWFDKNFPMFQYISNIKKVDFIIFATN